MSFGTPDGFAPPPNTNPELAHWFAQIKAVIKDLRATDDDAAAPAFGVTVLTLVPWFNGTIDEFAIAINVAVADDIAAVRVQHIKPAGGNNWPITSSKHIVGIPTVSGAHVTTDTTITVATGSGVTVNLVEGDEIAFGSNTYFVSSGVSISASSSGTITIYSGLRIALAGGESVTWSNFQTEYVAGVTTGIRSDYFTVQVAAGVDVTYSAADAADPIDFTLTPLEADGTAQDSITIRLDEVDQWPWLLSLVEDQAGVLQLTRIIKGTTGYGINFVTNSNKSRIEAKTSDWITVSTAAAFGTPVMNDRPNIWFRI